MSYDIPLNPAASSTPAAALPARVLAGRLLRPPSGAEPAVSVRRFSL
jgi:hypothetical protein